MYNGYRKVFDGAGSNIFWYLISENVVIFGVDNNSSSHSNDRFYI